MNTDIAYEVLTTFFLCLVVGFLFGGVVASFLSFRRSVVSDFSA